MLRLGLIILLLLAVVLYYASLDTGLQPEELRGGDLITHQYAQVQARPSNAPGYPLYTMGGWLWFHGARAIAQSITFNFHPINVLSSYSTFWGLIALGLLYQLLLRTTLRPDLPTGDPLIAWLLTAFYAVTYFFWYYATTTEQYTSAVAQTLAIVYFYLRWRERRSLTILIWLAFFCGLSFAHMLTVALIVPPLVAVILWEEPRLLRNGRALFGTVVAALVPLLSYSYVYLRGAAHPEWWGQGDWQNSQEWFWRFVSTAQGRQELGWGFEADRSPIFGVEFPQLIWHELSVPLLVVGLVGIIWLGRKLATLLYSTLALYLLFCWMYRFGNWYQVILPAYPLILLGVAAAAQRWRDWRAWRWMSVIGLIVALAWRFDASWPAVDSRNRVGDTALDRAAILVGQPLPVDTALFATVDDTLAIQYLIDIWQINPNLRTVDSATAGQRLRQEQSVLTTWDSLALLRSELAYTRYRLSAISPDWVMLHPPSMPISLTIEQELSILISDTVHFAGFTITPAPRALPIIDTPPTLDVTLFWQLPTGEWPAGLSISVRPLKDGTYLPATAGGIIQQDAPAPMHGLLAVESVTPNEIVADPYRLPLGSTSFDDVTSLRIILYRVVENGFEQVQEINLNLK